MKCPVELTNRGISYFCYSFVKLYATSLPTFYFNPDVIIKGSGLTHISDSVSLLDCICGNIGDRRRHVGIEKFSLICFCIIKRGLIWVGIWEIPQHHPEDVTLHGVVEPCVSGIYVWGAFQHCPIVLPEDRAFGWVNILNGGILLLCEQGFGGPSHAEINIARDEGCLWAVAIKEFNVRDEFSQFRFRLFQLRGIGGVDVIAQCKQGQTNHGA